MRRLTIKIVICQVVSEMLYAGKPIIQSESRVRRDSLWIVVRYIPIEVIFK